MKNNKDIWDALYNLRVILFVETHPQSNKYNQILLDPQQYKKMTALLHNSFPVTEDIKCGNPNCMNKHTALNMGDKEIILPDNIQDIHYCDNGKECTC